MIMDKYLIDTLYKNNPSPWNHSQQSTQYLYQVYAIGGNHAAGIQLLGPINWMKICLMCNWNFHLALQNSDFG